MPYFGVHQSISAGFDAAVFDAATNGFYCIQIFSANSSRWKNRPISPQAAARFKDASARTGLIMPLIHDSYLINLASPDQELLDKSIESFTDELVRADALGIKNIVMHPGAAKDDSRENGLERVAKSLDQIFEATPNIQTTVLLETTAGQGTYLGSSFEELEAIIEASSHKERLGVCFDTCHAFAAGYEFRTRETYDALFEQFDKIIGLERLRAFHLNDSVKGLGLRVDRHAHIGCGELGLEPFRMIVNDERFFEIPMYLETPKGESEKGEDWDVVNLRTLKSLFE